VELEPAVLRQCIAVEQKFNTDSHCSDENAEFTSRIIVLIRSVNCMQLCCCPISKPVVKYIATSPGGQQLSARGKRIVSTQEAIEVYETSHTTIRTRRHLLFFTYTDGAAADSNRHNSSLPSSHRQSPYCRFGSFRTAVIVVLRVQCPQTSRINSLFTRRLLLLPAVLTQHAPVTTRIMAVSLHSSFSTEQ